MLWNLYFGTHNRITVTVKVQNNKPNDTPGLFGLHHHRTIKKITSIRFLGFIIWAPH